MAERDRPHIFVGQPAMTEAYSPPPRAIGRGTSFAPADRGAHGRRLEEQLTTAERTARERRAASELAVDGALPGIYVTFESFPGLELALTSLDPRLGQVHPELVAVREELDADGVIVEQATVFIPDGKLGYFLGRLEQYLETTEGTEGRHRALIDRIQSIGVASLEQLWTDQGRAMPPIDETVWWEVWLRRRDGQEVERLRAFAQQTDVAVGDRILAFPDRLVVLVRATSTQLAEALDVLDDLAELRFPQGFPQILATESARDQRQWVDQLRERVDPAPADAPAACILDTGVNHAHPLLVDSLNPDDCHQCNPNWPHGDHDGHGTAMAGIALYGDLGDAITSGNRVRLRHRLESVTILPPTGVNPPELYGAITASAASRVEITAPERRRVFSMAVTTNTQPEDDLAIDSSRHLGRPTSWSASVDALAAGLGVDASDTGTIFLDEDEPGPRRLFIILAGNVLLEDMGADHLDRSDLEPVEDPAQAWNALSVGANTNLDRLDVNDGQWEGWSPVAPKGELSPFSKTSVLYGNGWPYKPDVVAEGGNVARSPGGGDLDTPEALQILTTRRLLPDGRSLTTTNGTSAATAEVAHIAASVLAEYEGVWPETLRALVVHSAEWTDPMRGQFDGVGTRHQISQLRRRYGMGVPDLTRATKSATDALTLVVQDTIHPFDGEGRMREMHLHELPWPDEALLELGDVEVRLRVTLSYFVEPNPSRRGWRGRYRYASHGLRFDLRRPTESTEEFRQRVNRLAREDEGTHQSAQTDAPEWLFGPDYRVAGSIHTDIWRGTASELARRGYLAVYPVSGWWKDRKDRDHSERGSSYALVVSIESPTEEVDLWTPVANQVGIAIEVEGQP